MAFGTASVCVREKEAPHCPVGPTGLTDWNLMCVAL